MAIFKLILLYFLIKLVLDCFKKNKKDTFSYEEDEYYDTFSKEEIIELGKMLEKIKNIDLEPFEKSFEAYGMSENFIEQIILTYTKTLNIVATSGFVNENEGSIDLTIEKYKLIFLKDEIVDEWLEFKEEIKNNGLKDKTLKKMKYKLKEIFRNCIYSKTEEEVTIFFENNYGEWEISKLSYYDIEEKILELKFFFDILYEIVKE